MKLLLDANVLVWALYEPERLPPVVISFLEEPSNVLLVSHATLWEMLAKIGRGRLLMAGNLYTKGIATGRRYGRYLPAHHN